MGHILEKNEEILWGDKPRFIPFLFSVTKRWNPSHSYSVRLFFVVFILLSFLISVFILAFIIADLMIGGNATIELLLNFYKYPQIQLVLLIYIVSFAYVMKFYKSTEYIFTSKRVIVKEGAIGTDFKYADYDKITDMKVDVGLIDKIFHTGSIVITPTKSRVPDMFIPNILKICNIRKPYDTFKSLKQIALDIKSDIFYPNKYRRMGINRGYFVKYNREDHERDRKSN